MEIFILFGPVLAAFITGSIPIGYFIGRLHGIDIRKHGSGNIGATNIKRMLGAKAGALTLVLDALKGCAAIYLGALVYQAFTGTAANLDTKAVFGACGVYGHCFSPFLKLRGGKGIATSLGIFLWICPIPTLIAALSFLVVVKTTRFVSLSSLCAVGAVLMSVFLDVGRIYGPATRLSVLFVAILVVFRHAENVQRLISGRELPARKKESTA